MDEEQDVQQAEKLIGEVSLPPEIKRIEVKAGFDWAGDPALKVTLWVGAELSIASGMEEELYEAAQRVQRKLLHSSISRYPFVSLDQAA